MLAISLKILSFIEQFDKNKFMIRSINKSASKHIIQELRKWILMR